MGFPFFTPIYIPNAELTIHGPVSFEDEPLEKVIGGQLTYRYFPIRIEELKSKIDYVRLKEGSLDLPNGVKVSYKFLNHPILCLGYRIEYENKILATCYDHEPFANLFEGDPENEEEGKNAAFEQNYRVSQFYKNADLLIHDSQYSTSEYKKYVGWGHSTYKYAITQALKANVKNLALFHHDPNRTDKQLDNIKETFNPKFLKYGLNVFPAYEKQEIEL